MIRIHPEAKDGARIVGNADIEEGRKMLSGAITVYRPEQSPLVGVWHESAGYDCNGQEMQGDDMLRELIFNADNSFKRLSLHSRFTMIIGEPIP